MESGAQEQVQVQVTLNTGRGKKEFYMVGIQPSQPIPLKIDIEVRAILKVESDQWLFAYRDENLVIIWTLPLEKYTIRHTQAFAILLVILGGFWSSEGSRDPKLRSSTA